MDASHIVNAIIDQTADEGLDSREALILMEEIRSEVENWIDNLEVDCETQGI